METFKIFDPTFEVKPQTIDFVPRPPSLRDLRIGLVENTKFNSDTLLVKIAAILEKDHGARSHIMRSKRTSGSPVDQEVLDEFAAQCDVAIAGIGD